MKILVGDRNQEAPKSGCVLERYARDMVARFNMEGCEYVSTPQELRCHLNIS